jgi:regulator of nonsense transcripts 2
VRALCDVPKACLQLVPYFARIVATLAQVFPDIPQGVIHHLEVEFHHLQAKKDATAVTLEPRVRNARYLAELAKFKCYPHGSFFVALKSLLDDFTHHNIDAACAMVETAGRALIRTPESKVRMENMLEVMMKLKNVKNMDSRRSAQIDWAYTEVKQPGRANQQRKKRPPMQEYIRHLIFTRLSKATAPDVAKKLLRVPWAESERYVLKCLLKVVRMRFTNIPLISSLVVSSSACPYYD